MTRVFLKTIRRCERLEDAEMECYLCNLRVQRLLVSDVQADRVSVLDSLSKTFGSLDVTACCRA